MQCDNEHDNNHKIISFRKIKPNLDIIKNKIEELKDIIDKFNNNIDEIILFLNNIKENIEKYYIIYNNILNNYNIKNRNYQIFYNLNKINNIYDDKIINDLKDIINENNINKKFNKLINIKVKLNKNNNINIESNDINLDNINAKFNKKKIIMKIKIMS